jgi:PHD/YefM family antitoxin component YafN of YafNO toxin-antitoxin module
MDARREAMQKNVQFVIDAEGHRKAVILPIEEYEEMMEDLHMGRAARKSRSEPRRPFKDVVKELRAAGEIDVVTS